MEKSFQEKEKSFQKTNLDHEEYKKVSIEKENDLKGLLQALYNRHTSVVSRYEKKLKKKKKQIKPKQDSDYENSSSEDEKPKKSKKSKKRELTEEDILNYTN